MNKEQTTNANMRCADDHLMIVGVDNRGLTFIGWVDLSGEGMITIKDARCIIRWGTTEHLAELAEDGPTENTMLGRARDVIVNKHNIQFAYYANEKRWL